MSRPDYVLHITQRDPAALGDTGPITAPLWSVPTGLDPSHVPLILRPNQRSCSFHDWHPKEERGRTLESQWEPSLQISLQRLCFPQDPPQISAWSTAPAPVIRPKRGLPFLSSQRHPHLRMIKGAMLLLFPSTQQSRDGMKLTIFPRLRLASATDDITSASLLYNTRVTEQKVGENIHLVNSTKVEMNPVSEHKFTGLNQSFMQTFSCSLWGNCSSMAYSLVMEYFCAYRKPYWYNRITVGHVENPLLKTSHKPKAWLTCITWTIINHILARQTTKFLCFLLSPSSRSMRKYKP